MTTNFKNNYALELFMSNNEKSVSFIPIMLIVFILLIMLGWAFNSGFEQMIIVYLTLIIVGAMAVILIAFFRMVSKVVGGSSETRKREKTKSK